MTAFDFDTLTLGEVATIENLSSMSISAIADESQPKGNALAALVMVIKRRSGEPTYSFNQALTVPLSEANALLGADEEVDAEEGKDEISAARAKRSKPRSSSTSD